MTLAEPRRPEPTGQTTSVRMRTERPARRSRIWQVLIGVTIVVMFAIGYPLARTVMDALGIGGDSLLPRMLEVLTAGSTWLMALNTLIAVAVGVGLALVLGAVFAWINERTDARMGFAARMLPLIPMFIPSMAGAIGWVFLASPRAGLLNGVLRDIGGVFGLELAEGPLNIYSWPGLIFAYVLFLTPYAYLTISSGLQSLDPALEEASRDAGAGALATFVRITLPSLKPALGAALLVTVTMGIAIFSIPLVIGTQAGIDILPVKIVHLMTLEYPSDTGAALGMSLILVAVVFSCWMLQQRMVAANAHATISGRSSNEAAVTLGRWKWVARAVMLAFLVLTSVLPLGALLLVSLQAFWSESFLWGSITLVNYRDLFANELVWGGLRNSLVIAAICATVAILLGVVLTLVTTRYAGTWGKLVDIIAKIPSTLTHIVIALAIIVAFAGPPFGWAGTFLIIGIAYVVLYIPQATFYAGAALQQIGPQLTEASAVSGASDGHTMRRILLPLMAPGLIAGWSLVFVLMTGDITASSMLAGTHTPVVGFVLLDMWTAGSYPRLAALGVLMTAVSTIVVLSVMRLRDRYLVVG